MLLIQYLEFCAFDLSILFSLIHPVKIIWRLAWSRWSMENFMYFVWNSRKFCILLPHMDINNTLLFSKSKLNQKHQYCILFFNQCELLYCSISKLCWEWFNNSCYVAYFLFLEWSCCLINTQPSLIYFALPSGFGETGSLLRLPLSKVPAVDRGLPFAALPL